MANLNALTGTNLNRAASIMEAASGATPAPRVDYPPYIEEAAAGAALALEKGHPQALRVTRSTTAEEWLDPKSIEGGHFQRAVARVLGGYEPNAMVDMSPKGMMEHIVADTVNMTLASRMDLAVKDRNPVMTEGMTQSHIDRVELARSDDGVAADITRERKGGYESVSPSRRLALIDVFHEMADVSDVARNEITHAARDVALMRAGAVERAGGIRSRIADFREEGVPLFRDGVQDDVGANHRAEELALGIGKGPMNEVEAGVSAHIAVKGPQNRGFDDGMHHDARVAVMVDIAKADEASIPAPSVVATRIEGMAILMREADDYAYSYTRASDNDPVNSLDMERLARGEMSSMSPDAQVRVFESLHSGDRVPALTAMRIHGAVRDMSSTERSVGIEQVEPARAGVAQAVMAARGREMSR